MHRLALLLGLAVMPLAPFTLPARGGGADAQRQPIHGSSIQ